MEIIILSDYTVIGGRYPSIGIGFAVDPLDIMRALGVTVASTVFSSSLVRRVFGQATISVHVNLSSSTLNGKNKTKNKMNRTTSSLLY